MVPRINIEQAIRLIGDTAHRFDYNIYNFVGRAGKLSEGIFLDAFVQRKYQDNGTTVWPAGKRQPNRAGLYRGGLIESGSLMSSIKTRRMPRINPTVQVYTDPNAFHGTMAHQGFCFAAVHNNDEGTQWNQVKNLPKRQFMPNDDSGDSSIVHDRIKKQLYPTIFELIPGSFNRPL